MATRFLVILFAFLGALCFAVMGLVAMQIAGTLADSLVLSTGETTVLAGCGLSGALLGAITVRAARLD